MRNRTVIVNDRMQRGYRYQLTEPSGRNFDPEFAPQLTPKEMLGLGVFCGKYMTDTRNEFPKTWFANAKLAKNGRDPSLNFFGVDASQPLAVWRKKGWIHPEDPRGWFQWYCRYYIGRRMPHEDLRQIRRWKAMQRHIRQVELNCEPGELTCRANDRHFFTGPTTVENSELLNGFKPDIAPIKRKSRLTAASPTRFSVQLALLDPVGQSSAF
jgi:hypothetical protein